MELVSLLLNLPWTLIGLLYVVTSIPTSLRVNRHPLALIFTVKSLWWRSWVGGQQGVRAVTIGNVVLMGKTLEHDLEHELIHVRQHMRAPFIHPLLYLYQSLRYGYRRNKYEQEAYGQSGSRYIN